MPSFFQKAREPMNSYTHMIGAVLSIIGTFVMIVNILINPNPTALRLISVIVFGISLMALYASSSIYHYVNVSPNALKTLRKLDHAMIYVLIAGTYTPILLNLLPRDKGITFTIVMWIVAFIGIMIKVFWITAPRFLSTSLYILMGWAIMFDLSALRSLPINGLWLLLLGGISYTIGGVIYAIKKPNLSPKFGFHELFHIFVIIGSVFHFFVVVLYV